MKHAAIPTLYKGIQFRSRLEAKYACLFDLLGWSWEYEPLDLNGWIPDFLIRSPLFRKPTLVEVKPQAFPEKEVSAKIYRAFGAKFERGKFHKKVEAAIEAEYYAEKALEWAESDWNASESSVGAAQAKLRKAKDATREAYGNLACNAWKKKLAYDILFLGLHPRKIANDTHLLGQHLDLPGWEPVFYSSAVLDPIWIKATNTIQWKAPR